MRVANVTRPDGHIDYGHEVFRTAEVACPVCGHEPGQPCRDMRRTLNPRDLRRFHAPRIWAGLEAQALTLKLIGREWFVISNQVPF